MSHHNPGPHNVRIHHENDEIFEGSTSQIYLYCYSNKAKGIEGKWVLSRVVIIATENREYRKKQVKSRKESEGDFLGDPVVKNPSSNAEDVGSLPSQRTKIPHVTGQLSPHATIRENPHAATKTQHSQNFFKKGSNNNCGGNSKRTKIRSGA